MALYKIQQRYHKFATTFFRVALIVGIVSLLIGIGLYLRGTGSYTCFAAIGIIGVIFSLIATFNVASVKQRMDGLELAMSECA